MFLDAGIRLVVRAAQRSGNAAERGMEVAKRVALGRLRLAVAIRGKRRRVPELVRHPRRLREQQRDDQQQAPEDLHFARHSSRPAMKMPFGRFLPMNTSTDSLLSF